MFTRPPPFFPKPPMIQAFQSQDANQNLGFFAPFPDRSEDWGSIRDKADYTDSSKEPNHEKVFLADGTDNSRYYSASDMTGMNRPRDDWNDHLDVPIHGGGLVWMDDDNLPYQCIGSRHRKRGSKYKSGVAAKNLEKMVWRTETKIQHLCSEIRENVSVRRKEAVEQTKYIRPFPHFTKHPPWPRRCRSEKTQLVNCGKKQQRRGKKMAVKMLLPKGKLIHLIHHLKSLEEPVYKTGVLANLFDQIGRYALNVEYKVTKQGNLFFGSLTVDGLFITRRKAENKGKLKKLVYKRAYTVLKDFPADVIIELGDPNADGTETLKVEKFNLITDIQKIQNVLASQKDGCDLPEALLHKINNSLAEPLQLSLVSKNVKRPNSCLYFMGQVMLDDCTLARVFCSSVETASEKAFISAMERIKNLSAKEIAYEKDLEVVDEVVFGKGLEVVDEVAFGKGLEVVDEVAFGKESEKDFPISVKERFEKIIALIKKKPPFQTQINKENNLNKIAAEYNLPHSLDYHETGNNDARVFCDLYLGGIFVAHSKGSSVSEARSLVYENAWDILCSKPFEFIKSKDRKQHFRKLFKYQMP